MFQLPDPDLFCLSTSEAACPLLICWPDLSSEPCLTFACLWTVPGTVVLLHFRFSFSTSQNLCTPGSDNRAHQWHRFWHLDYPACFCLLSSDQNTEKAGVLQPPYISVSGLRPAATVASRLESSSASGLVLNYKTKLVTHMFVIIHFQRDVVTNPLSPSLELPALDVDSVLSTSVFYKCFEKYNSPHSIWDPSEPDIWSLKEFQRYF